MGLGYKNSLVFRKNAKEVGAWHLGHQARLREHANAIENAKRMDTIESDKERLVREGKLIKEIAPILRGVKIIYRKPETQ